MGHILHPGYFPFCNQPYDCNTEPRTLEELMYEYWVARYWKITITMSDKGGADPPAPSYVFYFGLGQYKSPIQKEEEIPCNYDFNCLSGDCDSFEGLVFINGYNDKSLCSRIKMFFSRYAEGNDDFIYINEIPAWMEPTGMVSISFGDGHFLYLPYAIASKQPGADPDDYYEFIETVSIEISKYWSYGQTYDEDTGEEVTQAS